MRHLLCRTAKPDGDGRDKQPDANQDKEKPTEGMAGHITRNPNPEPENSEPEPEKPEPEKSDPYFGFQATVPEIIMGKSGSRPRYPNDPNNPNISPSMHRASLPSSTPVPKSEQP